jgi:hypothetical protein
MPTTRQWVLKPQDLVIAFKLSLQRNNWLSYKDLAKELSLSQFEAHAGAKRLVAARLAHEASGEVRPIRAALENFAIYGAPHAYPAVRGEMTIGFPTAHGGPPLKDKVMFSSESPPVWPHPEGTERGIGLLPMYEKLPLAARGDKALYELLALFDALRIGQARERELAAGLLQERLR